MLYLGTNALGQTNYMPHETHQPLTNRQWNLILV